MSLTDIFETLQIIASALTLPMVWVYLQSAKKNREVVIKDGSQGIRLTLANKEILIARTLLTIQSILMVIGIWAEVFERPHWIPPLARMSISILIFFLSYILWSRIVPLHTRRRSDPK